MENIHTDVRVSRVNVKREETKILEENGMESINVK